MVGYLTLRSFAIRIALFFIFFIACDYKQEAKNNFSTSSNSGESTIPDTANPVIHTNFTGKIFPQIFEAAYNGTTSVQQGELNFVFKSMDLGEIKIESGRIMTCDPALMFDAVPLAQNFPIGRFNVQLALASLSATHNRVAFSRICFSDKPVSKWEMALKPGQEAISLTDSTIYCFSVDSGLGVFIDSVSSKAFLERDRDGNLWDAIFIKKMEDCNYTGYIYDFSIHTLAAFASGWGDGCYATFIGYDEDGNVCRLLIDFGLVRWWQLKEKE